MLFFQTLSFAQYNLYSINNYSIKQDSLLQPLPTKAMFKSLLIPGWGQYQNKDDIWKTVAFISVEIAGIISSIQLTNKAENIRHDFEKYGDDHWTLERWYNNSRLIFPNNWKNILIGTHKLLSEKVHFHDLGLLIVDEEQRFGVAHKEKMKLLRRNSSHQTEIL